MAIHRVVPVAAAIISGILICAPLGAATKGRPTGGGGGGGTSAPTPAQTAAQQAAAEAAAAKAAAVSAAESKVSDATKTLNELVKKLTADFNASPDYLAAQQAVAAATKAHEEAKLPVIAGLSKTNASYKVASTKLATLQAKYDTQKKNSSPMLSDTSQQIYDLGNVMGPIEQAAIEKDPGCIDAKKKLDEAVAVVTKMLADFKASLGSNTDWVTAKATLDSAKTDLATAKAM